jgi:hypothetical protein
MEALAGALLLCTGLAHFNCSNNALGDSGLSALCANLLGLPRFTSLNCARNGVGPDGAPALGRLLPQLWALDASRNVLVAGAALLAMGIQAATGLTSLRLAGV